MHVVLECVECQDEGVMLKSNMSKDEHGRGVKKE